MGAEKLAPTGIRSPDRQAHSEWLYRLNYPGSYDQCTRNFIWKICKGERNCYWRRLDNIRRELECLNVLCALSHKFSPFAYTYKFVVQYIGKVIIGKAAGTWSWPLTSVWYEGKECMDLNLHSPQASSWQNANKHRYNCGFTSLPCGSRLSLKKCNARECNCFGRQIQQPWWCSRQCKFRLIPPAQHWIFLDILSYTSFLHWTVDMFLKVHGLNNFFFWGGGKRQKKLKHIIRSRTINPRLFRCLIAGSEGCRWELLVYTCGNSLVLLLYRSACAGVLLGDYCRGTLWTLCDECKAEIYQFWRVETAKRVSLTHFCSQAMVDCWLVDILYGWVDRQADR